MSSWAKGVVGNRVARLAVGVIALVCVGAFWVLRSAGVVEPGPTAGVVGVAIFVVLALPAGLLAGRASDRATGRRAESR